MPEKKSHDLHDFMRQLSQEMAAEYDRIQKRAPEDPGTAGDQGEANWAELLRGWLPRTYEVVTKGRIISADGRTSPQVDVLVLKDVYPKKLLDKKHYLAAGVAAAFECKTTLKSAHIAEAVQTCVEIKNLYPVREGSPYKELHAPIVYGLLAHSHSWKGPNSTPEENILQNLRGSDGLFVTHPRLSLDMLCVADLGAWTLSKMSPNPLLVLEDESLISQETPPCRPVWSAYMEHTTCVENQVDYFTPIGVLISYLSKLIAWEAPTLRNLVDYYLAAPIGGSSRGVPRKWDSSIYSSGLRRAAQKQTFVTGEAKTWDEWNMVFGPGLVKHLKFQLNVPESNRSEREINTETG